MPSSIPLANPHLQHPCFHRHGGNAGMSCISHSSRDAAKTWMQAPIGISFHSISCLPEGRAKAWRRVNCCISLSIIAASSVQKPREREMKEDLAYGTQH